jgi:hypothetical protein
MQLTNLAAATVIASLALTSPAHAGDEGSERDQKDPDTALALSAAGAGVSALLVAGPYLLGQQGSDWGRATINVGVTSSLLTPSLGQLYAGEYWTSGMTLRGAGAATALVAATLAFDGVGPGTSSGNARSNAASLLAVGAAGLYLAGVIYDVGHASDSARHANDRHLTFAPTMVGAGADRHMGLGLAGTF